MLNPRLVKAMAAEYALHSLKHDDDLRQGKAVMEGNYGNCMTTRDGRSALREVLPKLLSIENEAALDGKPTPWVADAIEQFTAHYDIPVDPNSDEYTQLVHAFGNVSKICTMIESERVTGNRESDFQYRMITKWEQDYKNKPQPTMTLTELFSLYADYWAKEHSDRPDRVKRKRQGLNRVLLLLNEYFGADKTVNEVTKREAGSFRDWVLTSQTKLNEQGADRLLDHIIAAYHWDLDERLNSPHLCKSNPFSGWKFGSGYQREKGRIFSDDELQLYIDLLVKFHDHNLPEKTWLPIIMLHSGMRPNEIAQLYLDDVRTEKGITLFYVQPKIERGQFVKKNRPRIVPIHPNLIELGLLAHVERMNAVGSAQLFPNCTRTEKGYYSDTLSTALNEIVDLVSDDAKLRIYSLRAQFRNIAEYSHSKRAYEANAMAGHYFDKALDDIMGHAIKGSVGDTTYRKMQIKLIADAMDSVDFPIDLSGLSKVLNL